MACGVRGSACDVNCGAAGAVMGNLTDAFFTVEAPARDPLLQERDEIDRALKQLPTAGERARLIARREEIERILARERD